MAVREQRVDFVEIASHSVNQYEVGAPFEPARLRRSEVLSSQVVLAAAEVQHAEHYVTGRSVWIARRSSSLGRLDDIVAVAVGELPREIGEQATCREEIRIESRQQLPLVDRRRLRAAQAGLPRFQIKSVARRQTIIGGSRRFELRHGLLVLSAHDERACEPNTRQREIRIQFYRLLVESE